MSEFEKNDANINQSNNINGPEKKDEEERELTPEEIKEKIKHKIGYLIIQEFPISNIAYVVGYKPYGKVWFDYSEVMEQYIGLMEDWQTDFKNGEIVNSKAPRIVKIFIMDDENVSGSDPNFSFDLSDYDSETVSEDGNLDEDKQNDDK